jgi:hypothetical protein
VLDFSENTSKLLTQIHPPKKLPALSYFALEFTYFTNLSLQVGVLPAYILELPLRILRNQCALINILLFMILLKVIQYKFHVPILFCFEFQASWRGLGAIIYGKNNQILLIPDDFAFPF